MSPTRRAVLAVVTVVLLAVAVWCLTRGIEVRPSTGGLLTAPVPLTRLHGGWLVAAAAAGTAAVVTALEAATRRAPPDVRRTARLGD